MAGGAGVRLEGVEKRYGRVTAVKAVDLVVEAGTLVTLLGPSGCGKTTLLRLIAGLETPSRGRVWIGGRDVTAVGAGERDVSMVFQSYALFPHLSVQENVAYGLASGGVGRREAARRAEATLASVGLQGLGARMPSELSGGQQQRVAVARALVLEPAVLLFDEPLSNLDTRLRRQVRDEIRALQQSLGVTVVYVTHDQGEALAVSDRIVVMREAGIAQAGSPRELYEAPSDVFVATFMGETNRVTGLVEATDGAVATVRLASVVLRLPDRAGNGGGPVDVVIRPEAIVVGEPAADGLAGRIVTATYMGSHAEYTVETPVGTLFAVASEAGRLRPPGTLVGLTFRARGVLLVRASPGAEPA